MKKKKPTERYIKIAYEIDEGHAIADKIQITSEGTTNANGLLCAIALLNTIFKTIEKTGQSPENFLANALETEAQGIKKTMNSAAEIKDLLESMLKRTKDEK